MLQYINSKMTKVSYKTIKSNDLLTPFSGFDTLAVTGRRRSVFSAFNNLICPTIKAFALLGFLLHSFITYLTIWLKHSIPWLLFEARWDQVVNQTRLAFTVNKNPFSQTFLGFSLKFIFPRMRFCTQSYAKHIFLHPFSSETKLCPFILCERSRWY